MKQTPPVMMISYKGEMKFLAENPAGLKIPVEPGLILGGSGSTPNPIDYLLASLGSCAGIKVLIDLKENGITPDSLNIVIAGTRRASPPAVFEELHLTFHFVGMMDERTVAEAINRTMTLMCPVAVMIGKAVKVTWDYGIAASSNPPGSDRE